jgi:hypothetical protein
MRLISRNAGRQGAVMEDSCRKETIRPAANWCEKSASSGEFVSDVPKRPSGTICPRCHTSTREITRIAPLRREPGLIAYECSACAYLTSVILPAGEQTNEDAP